MLHFASDYQEGAHPEILRRLIETNSVSTAGYGTDEYCESARAKIREACRCPGAEVHFLMGGTQTNATVIGALLRPYQGVVAADSGHISVHEAGAVELGGHKVLTLPQRQGKISAEQVRRCCESYRQDENRDHLVMPGMGYISQPTEFGTLYSLRELEDLHRVCREFGIPLYADGARLAYALGCRQNDAGLADLARLCDVFYIGGTKCGALFGEAVVIPKPDTIPHFFSMIKQHGALLAKGRLLGVQFDALFTDGLYERIGRPAVALADRIRAALREQGRLQAFEAPTNQIFLILTREELSRLSEKIEFSFWENTEDGRTVVRAATSWSTDEEKADALIRCLEEARKG